jgi:hypothetical protein
MTISGKSQAISPARSTRAAAKRPPAASKKAFPCGKRPFAAAKESFPEGKGFSDRFRR